MDEHDEEMFDRTMQVLVWSSPEGEYVSNMKDELDDLKQKLKSYHDENTFLMNQNIDLKQQLEKK